MRNFSENALLSRVEVLCLIFVPMLNALICTTFTLRKKFSQKLPFTREGKNSLEFAALRVFSSSLSLLFLSFDVPSTCTPTRKKKYYWHASKFMLSCCTLRLEKIINRDCRFIIGSFCVVRVDRKVNGSHGMNKRSAFGWLITSMELPDFGDCWN